MRDHHCTSSRPLGGCWGLPTTPGSRASLRRHAIWSTTVLLGLLVSPALPQTNVVWSGAAGTSSYSNPVNWDIGVVPINGSPQQ